MKRVLLIGFILAILILAMPQGVLALTQGSNVDVKAIFAPPLTFSASSASTSGSVTWNLGRGSDNLYPSGLSFTIGAAAPWDITASHTPTGSFTKGHMSGATHQLAAPFQMTLGRNVGVAAPSAGTMGDLTSGTPIVISSEVPRATTYNSNMWQTVTGDDWGEQLGYSMTIVFTATAAF
jgi:hypothetical protein